MEDRKRARLLLMSTTDLADLLTGPAASSELLRMVTTAGSVDDGKSTLIGRLLYDTKTAFVDQLQHVEETFRAGAATSDVEPRVAHRRSARRARAGHHDRRRVSATSRRRRASSSSATRPATCSTRATWSPARPPPTWRSSSSTHGKVVVEQSRRHALDRIVCFAHPAARVCDQQDGSRRLRASSASSRLQE